MACLAPKSRLKPSLKRVRIRQGTNVFPLELNEYQKSSYVKKYMCPNCLGDLLITVRSEKSGLLYYKLTVVGFILLFLIGNALLLQNSNSSSFSNNIIMFNAIILGIMIVLVFLLLINNYLKTRSIRAIRLKIRASTKMSHRLYKSKRTEFTKKKSVH